MKTPAEVLAELARRLEKTWSQVVTGAPWAPEVRLGTSGLTGARLAEVWSEVQPVALHWQQWVADAGSGVSLTMRAASLHRTPQPLPATLQVADIDTAARLVSGDWPDRLARGRDRLDSLRMHFPHHADPAAILRTTDAWSDVDVDLLLRTARWFASSPASGLTARQVPVVGLGTKWLASRESVVRRLAGLDSLGLVPGRPPRVHLTYLDPAHLALGERRHDVVTIGDADTVAYRPRVVLISENRDTAQLFGPVEGGIALEGEGRGAGAAAALTWVRDAPHLWYWGDMDADGLEILHGFRAAGLPVRSLFMDLAAYERWERFGVDHDHRGMPIGPRTPRDVHLLEPGERALYGALCSPDWTRHRRIEQERIPLEDAAAVVRAGSAVDHEEHQDEQSRFLPVGLDDSADARSFIELSSIASDLKIAEDALDRAARVRSTDSQMSAYLVDFAAITFMRATTTSNARDAPLVSLREEWTTVRDLIRDYRNRTLAHSQSDLTVTYPVGWLDRDTLEVADVSAMTVFSPLPQEKVAVFQRLIAMVLDEVDQAIAPIRARLIADLQSADDLPERASRPVVRAVGRLSAAFDPRVSRPRFPSSHPVYWDREDTTAED